MTTSRCSHLPEVLPDCTDSAPPGKAIVDSTSLVNGQPQYVMQVSAKDGQLLSTVVRTLATQSPFNDRPMCRICHEGSSQEDLLSPCECTGTLGTIHQSCLEHWLSASNTSFCELCHFKFAVERKPRPVIESSSMLELAPAAARMNRCLQLLPSLPVGSDAYDTLKADGSQSNVQEFVLLFSVFDEAQSWYGEADMFRERIQNTRKTVKKQYHSINGFVNSTLTGLKMCQKKKAHWHLIGMGTAPEIHSVRFHGHTLLVQNHRKVSFDMTPMTFATAQLTAVNTGRFLISCQIHAHQHDGMNAYFSVESCPEELQERQVTPDHDDEYEFNTKDLLSGLFEMPPKLNVRSSLKKQPKKWVHYIAAEEVVWDYAPIIHNQRYRSLSTMYLEKGPQRIGKQYKKAVYVEYTDGTFRKRTPKNGPDRGIMGPVLRGETGDEFQL
ncbi:E3 ubiquitin-protein ligase MARCH3 [Acipenser ruthenus]|uniref:RING-type E3 ubiquitin transferase n=1 Tax=Acipenser ruthenus TaxID=7906 RepID=A0A444V7T8_ACIRT|nr:E3 ubiquitin-protein ligase MARCH3 [Acipenser ruthenus]